MDFHWNEEQLGFRATVRRFLAEHLPSDWETLAHGPASEVQSVFAAEFCSKLAEAGLLVPHWPARWGGRDADAWTAFILAEEMWMAGEPRGGQYMNVNWIGPTLMRFGSEVQQQRYIPPMARGRTIWCQGFSEPEAGSISPRCARVPISTVTVTESAARRSGPPTPAMPTPASCWRAPRRARTAFRSSSCRWTSRASPCARSRA
jgi:alkylation response protein AidB-like acyl-CoA dehydrogenase